jgi:hypothetical protein
VGKKTFTIAVSMILVLIEKQIFLGLVTGKIRAFERENSHIALWTNIPRKFLKFYCIGSLHLHGLSQRFQDFALSQERKYVVSALTKLRPMADTPSCYTSFLTIWFNSYAD